MDIGTLRHRMGQKNAAPPPPHSLAASIASNLPTASSSAASVTADIDDHYAFLTSFNTIFLVDDSGYMAGGRWREIAEALRTTTPICTAHDEDGIDIYFPHRKAEFHQGVNDAARVEQIFNFVKPGDGTLTSQRPAKTNSTKSFVSKDDTAVYEPVIEGRMCQQDVVACPDTGAGLNLVSYQFALRNHLQINKRQAGKIKNAIGAVINTIGTVNLPFTFKNDLTALQTEFHVLQGCPKDVILGSAFLRLSETLSQHAYRITYRLKQALTPRLWYCGPAEQRVRGWLNGNRVDALPDTGSDLMLISADYALRNRLQINRSLEHRKCIEFADGSRAYTTGVVKDMSWKYDSYNNWQCNFYVLEGLRCDVILSHDFLFETKAFKTYEENFFDLPPDMVLDDASISLMREGRSLLDKWQALKDLFRGRRLESPTVEPKKTHYQAHREALAKYKQDTAAARCFEPLERDRILSQHGERHRSVMRDITETERQASALSQQHAPTNATKQSSVTQQGSFPS